jgi:hypothetical protein
MTETGASSIISNWDWDVNDVLVLSTLVIFVFVMSTCLFMWITRSVAKKSNTDTAVDYRTRNGGLLRGGKTLRLKRSSSTNETPKLKDKKKSSKKKKYKGGKSDVEEGYSTTSSSHEAESLLGGRVPGIIPFITRKIVQLCIHYHNFIINSTQI